MGATEHTNASAVNGRRSAVHNGVAGGSASVERLVEHATALQMRAPELALILGERAAAVAEATGANELWVRAESLVVHARVRLGHRASTVGRAVAALRAAEDAGGEVTAAQLRTDLAVCARSVGAPLTGLAALRPVLTVGGLSSVQRATALCHLVGCLGTFGRKVELDRVLLEGDRLISVDAQLDGDSKLLARAMMRVGVSAHRRRHGDVVGAADAARTGIGFLDDLGDKGADGGLARVRLVLELVCALLDRGDGDLALEVAEPLLAEPERAASVAPLGWLRLAVATRIQLVNGSAEAAARTLRDAVHSTGRHGLYALAARLWLELAHVEERIGQRSEALQCLYRARASEHLHGRVSSQARALLTGAFGAGEQAPVDLAEVVAAAAQAAQAGAQASAYAAHEHARQSTAQQSTGRHGSGRHGAGVAGSGAQGSGRRHAGGAQPDGGSSEARNTDSHTAPRRDAESRPRVVLPMLRLAPGSGGEEEPERETEPGPDQAADPVSPTEVTAAIPAVPASDQASGRAGGETSGKGGGRRRKPEPDETPAAEGGDRPVWDIDRPPFTSVAKTRHDSEHGSVAARSVLDRLGISPGGSGGRRRAADEADTGLPRQHGSTPGPRTPDEDGPGRRARDDSSAPVPGPSSVPDPPSGPDERDTVPAESYSFLPRVKLPPSLAPLDDLADDSAPASAPGSHAAPPESSERSASSASSSAASSSSTTSSSAPSSSSPSEPPSWGSSWSPEDRGGRGGETGGGYGSQVPSEDPPPDAGLAELLARALAEHQAGTSSAAALVKQLGVDDERDRHSRVNGKHRGEG